MAYRDELACVVFSNNFNPMAEPGPGSPGGNLNAREVEGKARALAGPLWSGTGAFLVGLGRFATRTG